MPGPSTEGWQKVGWERSGIFITSGFQNENNCLTYKTKMKHSAWKPQWSAGATVVSTAILIVVAKVTGCTNLTVDPWPPLAPAGKQVGGSYSVSCEQRANKFDKYNHCCSWKLPDANGCHTIIFGPAEAYDNLNEWKWVCLLFECKIRAKDTQIDTQIL